MSVALQYTTDLYIYVGLKIESKLKKKKEFFECVIEFSS